MITLIEDIHDYEVSALINKLISFIGRKEVERCLEKYRASLQSSSYIFREYYLKYRHPWWHALTEFFEIEKSGKSVRRHLSEELKILAGDAKKINTLQKIMPECIKEKYKRDLADDERAYDYLFELQIAWHFFLKGYYIKWHENDSERHSEFLVKASDFEFNVECKRISVDASRKIRRRDFYRLAEKVIPNIEDMGYFGIIDIILEDKLDRNENFLNKIVSQVCQEISNKRLNGDYKIPSGTLHLELKQTTGIPINIHDHFNDLWKRKSHQAHGVIIAKAKYGKPVDPIELTLMCNKSNKVLDGIRDTISEAGKLQLDKSKPGLIVCFLEGIDDLSELATDSGLQIMSSLLLLKDSFAHIAALCYSSEKRIEKDANTERFPNQALIYRNPLCKFEQARDFQFLSRVENKFQYRLSDILPSKTSR
jgi:hypothetical protein